MGKVYRGNVMGRVTVDGQGELPKRRDLRDYSQWFGWGHLGAECTQLALAILADHFHDDNRAAFYAVWLKEAVLVNLPRGKPWVLTEEDIAMAITAIDRSIGRRAREARDDGEVNPERGSRAVGVGARRRGRR